MRATEFALGFVIAVILMLVVMKHYVARSQSRPRQIDAKRARTAKWEVKTHGEEGGVINVTIEKYGEPSQIVAAIPSNDPQFSSKYIEATAEASSRVIDLNS